MNEGIRQDMRAAARGRWWPCVAVLLALLTPVPATAGRASALDTAAAALCDKQVVLLGEDANHGAGRTMAFKARLVERLVRDCAFSAVAFESQVYDFLDLDESMRMQRATREQVANAIGGLWSRSAEVAPLVEFLFARAMSGDVRLLGLDPQTGGATQLFTQQQLPIRLAGVLDGARRAECTSELRRLTMWQYDARSPYDDAARGRLRACTAAIRAALAKGHTPSMDIVALMVANLERSLDLASDDAFNLRDRAMFENLQWHRSRLPRDAKVIVWCATVHAGRQLPRMGRERIPLGAHVHRALGGGAASVGFSALEGRRGLVDRTASTLERALPDSIEQLAFASAGPADAVYVGRGTLSGFGPAPGRALDYGRYDHMDWSQVLDGLVVLRDEQPTTRLGMPGPQPAP